MNQGGVDGSTSQMYWTAYDGLTTEEIGADAGKYSRPRQFIFSVKFTM